MQGSQRGMPTSEGDEAQLAALRAEYIGDAEPLGTVPPGWCRLGFLSDWFDGGFFGGREIRICRSEAVIEPAMTGG